MRRLLVPHLALWVLGAAALRVVAVPAEACPAVSVTETRAAIERAADWLHRGIRPDGRFLYGYTPANDEVSADYNDVRHAGALYSLYQAAVEVDPIWAETGDRALRRVLDNLFQHGDWTAFAPAGTQPQTGANSLVIAALIHRRQVTGDTRHDELLRQLGRFLVAQQQPNGSILKYWNPRTEAPEPGNFGKFAPGESFWALTMLDAAFPDEGWGGAARAIGDYLATERDLAEGFLPRQPDHWASYALAQLSRDVLSEIDVAYARRLSGYFGTTSMYESQRTGSTLAELFRGEAASGAGAGVMGEALGSLWQASLADPRLADLSGPLSERIECLTGLIVERQLDGNEAGPFADPGKVEGAWFRGGYTQVDDQQHSLSALILALPVLERKP
jgi:hypothetical protein